jgi:hypothetical protein
MTHIGVTPNNVFHANPHNRCKCAVALAILQALPDSQPIVGYNSIMWMQDSQWVTMTTSPHLQLWIQALDSIDSNLTWLLDNLPEFNLVPNS